MEMSDRKKLILSLSNEESRRVTREAAQGALFRLMRKTDMKNIRVVDLVKVAGISRSAFYRNYHSVEDVLLDAVDTPILAVSQAIGQRSADNWKLLLQTVRNHEQILKALSDAGLFYVLLDRMNAGCDRDNYIMAMWNGLIFNVIQRWVEGGMKESVDEMLETVDAGTRRLAESIRDGVSGYPAARTGE